jgi:hypothetical protein
MAKKPLCRIVDEYAVIGFLRPDASQSQRRACRVCGTALKRFPRTKPHTHFLLNRWLDNWRDHPTTSAEFRQFVVYYTEAGMQGCEA